MLRSKFGLDFFILDDATLCGVYQEHAAWLQTTFTNNAGLFNIENTSFACKNYQVIVGHPVTPWTQTIAVKDCTNHGSIRETYVCGTIPGFHHCGMETIEIATLSLHTIVVFPGFWNHHQQCMRQRTPAKMEQLQHLIEAC